MIWEKTLSDLKESTPEGCTANYYPQAKDKPLAVSKVYKPKTITLPAEIVELVMNNCSDGEPPQNQEEWNKLIVEIVEEHFNF